ncbi:MAG: OB-fold nucleic acid binding domain-containing protein, partial [Burkholderiales bacterium]
QRERQAAQVSLFGDAEHAGGAESALLPAHPWDLKQKLAEEKVALGFALSGHLFSVYERDLAGFARVPLAQLTAAEHRVWLAGVVASARTQMTRRGRMMVVVLDDGSAQLELSVFNELFERHRDKLKEDALLIVQGKAQRDEFSGGLRVTADELYDLAALRERFAARLRLQMNGHSDARQLMELLTPYRAQGACPVFVHYETGGAACDVALGDAWRVRPDGQLLERLGAWLAPENVQVVYSGGA